MEKILPFLQELPTWVWVGLVALYILVRDGSNMWEYFTGKKVKNATLKARLVALEKEFTDCREEKIKYEERIANLDIRYQKEMEMKTQMITELTILTEKQKVVIESTIAQLIDGNASEIKAPIVNRLLENLQKYVN